MAGIAFALLYGAAVVLIRLSVAENISERDGWLADGRAHVSTAIHLVAYAGIAFLWFMGVVRSHLGVREDRFLATVFVGSGYLFLAMTFAAGAVTSGLIYAYAQAPVSIADRGGFAFGSRVAFELVNVYAVRMAGVFMISLATLSLRTGILPRAVVGLTYLLAAALLVSIGYTLWVTLVFPTWVLLLSVYLLWRGIDDMPGATD